jgi:hypothetical protein
MSETPDPKPKRRSNGDGDVESSVLSNIMKQLRRLPTHADRARVADYMAKRVTAEGMVERAEAPGAS